MPADLQLPPTPASPHANDQRLWHARFPWLPASGHAPHSRTPLQGAQSVGTLFRARIGAST